MADKPVTREEKYLAYLTGDYKGEIPKPITRKEQYLYELCLKGIGGEISPEEIKNAVNEYLEKNPVKPGATAEQAQQIEQNKTDIASLKTDLSTKITKFYASSQGETHLADSDNGKIMDMMLYGKSEQKQYSGDNIYYMDYEDYSQTYNGVRITSTKFGYSVSGTFSGTGAYTLINRYITLAPGTYKMLLKNISALKIGLSKRDYSAITTISEGKTDTTFTLDEETEVCLTIRYSNTTSNETNEIMLTKNLEATSYEPYTGGIPSPNPDYPQEIKSVVNPTVKVCGKNLLNYNAWKGTPITRGTAIYENNGITLTATKNDCYSEMGNNFPDNAKIKVSEGETLTLSWEQIENNKEGYIYIFGNGIASNSVNIDNRKSKKLSYTVPSGVTFITFRFGVAATGDTISYKNIQIEKGSEATSYEPYHDEQTVTLPYTLNAIPVSSGGNVTIDGQQYIADYVDVEHGKVIRNILKWRLGDLKYGFNNVVWHINISELGIDGSKIGLSNMFKIQNGHYNQVTTSEVYIAADGKIAALNMRGMADEEFKKWLREKNPEVYNVLTVAEEIPITPEEALAFKQLMTYYPVTNISVNSEQLDGYTVFNYPISMANGWNYVKQQLNDNRDYIYDMDLQSAEAYVNSEYAVALTELEV